MKKIPLLTAIRHSFFTRIILILFIISATGVFIGSYLSTKSTFERLLSLEERYTERVAISYAVSIEQLVEQIQATIRQLYYEDVFGHTIESLLRGYILGGEEEEHIKRLLENRIELITLNTPSITDTVLFSDDYSLFLAYSKVPGRAVHTTFPVENDQFFLSFKSAANNLRISAPYRPQYINFQGGGASNTTVVSFGINIFNRSVVQLDKPLGTIILNVDPALFRSKLDSIDSEHIGRYLIRENRYGTILFDSQQQNAFSWDAPDLIIGEIEIANGLLTLIRIVNPNLLTTFYTSSRVVMWNIMIITISILLIFALLMSIVTKRRLRPLTEHMRTVHEGNLSEVITISRKDEIGDLEELYNSMIQKLQEYIDLVYTSRLDIQEAQLRILQQQINPHFVYNTLQSISVSALMHKDTKTAKMINLLGTIFRWALDDSTAEVSLGEELLYVQKFVELQMTRFEQELHMIILIPEEIKKFGIPKLLLQPLVENAIHHGIYSASCNTITIEAHMNKEIISIAIKNPSEQVEMEKLYQLLHQSDKDKRTHLGLQNVHTRIQMFYKTNNHDIGIESIAWSSGIFTISIAIPAQLPNKRRIH